MCELLAMSANVPTDICFSFTGLIQRGGNTGPHKDGWGITFYQGKGFREFRDPNPSVNSEIAQFIRAFPIKSDIVISHIRKANRGRVCLENTHPFTRELWGLNWTYAHNGQLKGIKRLPLAYYQPIGTTDSEYAFCWMMDQIRVRFPKKPRNDKTLWRFVHGLTQQLSVLGVFNMILTDSRYLYCHCSTKLAWVTRQAPFCKAKLLDEDVEMDFSEVTTPTDVVTVVATQPLTCNEQWHIMQQGDLVVFEQGRLVQNFSSKL